MIVIVRLTGGLGNQLFQYAAGRALAHVRGARLLLDASAYENERLGREYRLDRFCIQARVTRSTGVMARVKRRIERCLPEGSRRLVFTEESVSFDNRLLGLDRSVELRGYWQSERYFASIAPMLRQELTFCQPPIGRNATLSEEIANARAVSIHVRRGDYVSNSSHLLLPLAYYEVAIDQIARREPDAHFFVFSDDISWCREHLQLPGSATFVGHNSSDADFEDLRLMSLCQHHVIANSSFSWWGAWLATRPGKMVVAPGRWFARQPIDRDSRFPSEWVVLTWGEACNE